MCSVGKVETIEYSKLVPSSWGGDNLINRQIEVEKTMIEEKILRPFVSETEEPEEPEEEEPTEEKLEEGEEDLEE